MPDAPVAWTPPTLRPIRRVIVAVDLSIESAGAVHAAGWLAERYGAELHAAHVIEPLSATTEQALPELAEAHDNNAREELEKFAGTHGLEEAQLHVRKGPAVRELLDVVEEVGADLLVIGRYGPGGLKSGRLGSIAGPLLRRCPAPVLLAQPERREIYRSVLVASDLEGDPDRELLRGMELAERLGLDEIALAHAFPVPHGYHRVLTWADAVEKLKTVYTERANAAIERVQAWRTAQSDAEVSVRLLIEEGASHTRVPEIAAREGMDVIVMNPHARSGAARLLLPPTAERIMQGANCSVWAERDPKAYEGIIAALKRLVE
ncbi:MAG: universal stress protein [Planctomycetota bacterium]